MKKVVINDCHGGFGLSHEAVVKYSHLCKESITFDSTESTLLPYVYYKMNGNNREHWHAKNIKRDDPILVMLVEQMGYYVNDKFSELKVVEIPDDVNWYVEEYDGLEWVAEVHRTWR